MKLLSDGNWHTAYIDLRTMALHFDDSNSLNSISLYPSTHQSDSASRRIVEIDVHIRAQVTGIRIVGEENWLCGPSNFVSHIRQYHVSYLDICAVPGGGSRSYCSCKGPNNALNGGRGTASCPASGVDPSNGA